MTLGIYNARQIKEMLESNPKFGDVVFITLTRHKREIDYAIKYGKEDKVV